MKVKSLSRVRLLATSWTAAHQAPPSMGFSRQEYWSGVPSPSPFTMLVVHNSIILTHNMIVLSVITYSNNYLKHQILENEISVQGITKPIVNEMYNYAYVRK